MPGFAGFENISEQFVVGRQRKRGKPAAKRAKVAGVAAISCDHGRLTHSQAGGLDRLQSQRLDFAEFPDPVQDHVGFAL